MNIKENETMKQILADSFGGVLYDVANHNKYDTDQLLAQWDAMTEGEREAQDGIVWGAINFITGK